MDKEEMLRKLKSIKLCLMAHPDYGPDSEFFDRVEDLEDIENYLNSIGIDEDDLLFKY